MLIQQENNSPIASYHAPLQTLASADEVVDTRQPALVLQVGSALDPGLERRQRPNEDTLFVTHGVMPSASTSPKPFALLMVADGMGGQGHGQEASQLAVGSLVEYICGSLCSKRVTREALLPLLIEGVKYANRVVQQRNQERRTEMGTTMTATLVVDTTAYVAHVGDSRLYLYRPAKGLSQITQDHSLVAALVAAGVNQPEDIYTHPMRNLIYRFLGEKSTVEVDAYTVPLAAGDIVLLCSDGLWEMVRDRQIAAILTTPLQDSSREAHALVQAALAGGGVDNVSVIVAEAAKRFFVKALHSTACSAPHVPAVEEQVAQPTAAANPATSVPRVINVDENAAYPKAMAELKAAGQLAESGELRQVKYLNNIVAQDHRFIKRLVKPGMGFFSFETAGRTLQGYEVMHMIRKGQVRGVGKGDISGQVFFITSLFGVVA